MDNVNEAAVNSVMTAAPSSGIANDGTGVLALDPWLSPFKAPLKRRFAKAQDWITKINKTDGGLDKFSRVRRNLLAQLQANL